MKTFTIPTATGICLLGMLSANSFAQATSMGIDQHQAPETVELVRLFH
jgi:hypothetical protein